MKSLLHKYMGPCSTFEANAASLNSNPVEPALGLPSDIGQWPTEWRWKLKENIDELRRALDLSWSDAQRAAEAGVRYEYGRRCAIEPEVEGEMG